MKAYAEGKEIQFKDTYYAFGVWEDFDQSKTLSFNWSTHSYRVRPESKYIPFTYEDREQLRGKWVKYKDGGSPNKREHVITGIDVNGITTQTDRFSYAQLLEIMIFTNDVPCGKIVEE